MHCTPTPHLTRLSQRTKSSINQGHTGANFITMLVTRARANSSKNHTLLMCRIWKMGRNLFSSLDIRDNFKVAYLEKNSNNPKIYLVTITVWGTGSVMNWVNLSSWLPNPRPQLVPTNLRITQPFSIKIFLCWKWFRKTPHLGGGAAC